MLKITTKSTHFSLQRRRYQYCGLNSKQIKYKRSQNLSFNHRAIKSLQIARIFWKMWIKKQHYFSNYKLFSSSQQYSVYLHKSMDGKWTFSLRIYSRLLSKSFTENFIFCVVNIILSFESFYLNLARELLTNFRSHQIDMQLNLYLIITKNFHYHNILNWTE